LQEFDQSPVDVAEAEQAEVKRFHVCEPENIPRAGTICSRPWKAGVNIAAVRGSVIFSAANFRG
jgi:hypothetical protein